MTVHVTPLHDPVLVRRLEEKETAKGGIILQAELEPLPENEQDYWGPSDMQNTHGG